MIKKIFSYKSLFLLLPFIYFFLYAPYGLDDIDGGYTVSLAYRIFQGQIPYRDFVIVRPALSPYLHAIPLMIFPATMQVIGERLLCYLEFAFSVFLTAEILSHFFNLEEYKTDKYLLASIFFIFCVYSFPPIPLHTIDGILLGVIGIYFLSINPSRIRIVTGMFFLFLCALTKQSFYPMPLAGLLFLIATTSGKKILTGFISLLTFALCFILLLQQEHLLSIFIFWTNGSLGIGSLIDAGIKTYFRFTNFKLLIYCSLLFFGIKYFSKYILKKNIETGWLIVVYIITILSDIIIKSLSNVSHHYPFGYPQVFFVITIAGIIFSMLRNKKIGKEEMTLLFLAILSWCVSISWGFKSPILYSAPLIFGLMYWNKNIFHFTKMKLMNIILLVGGFISFAFSYQNISNDIRRSDLVCDMGKVFPKLSYIKSDSSSFNKFSDLKNISNQYKNFFTLPAIPFSHYLTNTTSPIIIDWPINVEINRQYDLIESDINSCNCYAFVEKKPAFDVNNEKWGSEITSYVVHNWQKIDENGSFYVYQKR